MAKEPASRSEATGQTQPARQSSAHPLVAFRQEMDRLFDNFFGDWPFGSRRPLSFPDPFRGFESFRTNVPSIDVSETDEDYEVEAELPGMDEKDISLEFRDGMLTLKGERKEEKSGKNVHWTERRYGTFQRSFPVPDGVDESRITARFKNGVLTVSLPKRPEAQKQSRKIEVKSG